jgi:hypothetical protein
MDTDILIVAAIASVVIFIIAAIVVLMSSTRLSMPNYRTALWPPEYYFPKRARSGRLFESGEGEPTGAFRLPTNSTGIALGEDRATSKFAFVPEADPGATGFMSADALHTGIEVKNEAAINEVGSLREKMRQEEAQKSQKAGNTPGDDPWLDGHTNKNPSPPRGVNMVGRTSGDDSSAPKRPDLGALEDADRPTARNPIPNNPDAEPKR